MMLDVLTVSTWHWRSGELLIFSLHWQVKEAGSNIDEGMLWLQVRKCVSRSESYQAKAKSPSSVFFHLGCYQKMLPTCRVSFLLQ